MIRRLVFTAFSRAAKAFAPPALPQEREYKTVVTGAGDPVAEVVKATSVVQASELAAGAVAKRRLATTAERSWRLTVLCEESRLEVDVQCVLKAEVCG